VRDIEVEDRIPTSDIRTFMCYDKDFPRETNSSMFNIEMESVLPDLSRPEREEWRLSVRVLPLRFYIDQEALEFLTRFFSGMESSHNLPETEPIYFQNAEIKSIRLKIDYQPRQLDYQALHTDKTAFLAKATPLRAATLHLKKVKVNARGWGELFGKRLVEAYVPHLRKTQIYNLAAGIGPVRWLLNVGSGVSDLIYTPVQQWQKDGRILTGLQRGTSSAVYKLVTETLNATTNMTAGVQYVLESADSLLRGTSGGAGTSAAANPSGGGGPASIYTTLPASASEGVQQAYNSLSRELSAAAHRVVAVPLEEYARSGTTGYLSSLVTGVPVAIIRPMIGVTEGVTKTLIGVSKWVDPSLKVEMETKFKNRKGSGTSEATAPIHSRSNAGQTPAQADEFISSSDFGSGESPRGRAGSASGSSQRDEGWVLTPKLQQMKEESISSSGSGTSSKKIEQQQQQKGKDKVFEGDGSEGRGGGGQHEEEEEDDDEDEEEEEDQFIGGGVLMTELAKILKSGNHGDNLAEVALDSDEEEDSNVLD
jgi:hypothetical protein